MSLYENLKEEKIKERKESSNKNISKKLDSKEKSSKFEEKIIVGNYNDAPDYLKDNELIKTGYLINCHSLKMVLRSLFVCSNETINIWSHLIGCIISISLIILTAMYLKTSLIREMTQAEYEDLQLKINETIIPWSSELRKHKNMSAEEATNLIYNNIYFATMMVYMGDADGMVSGANHSTSDTLRPALQIIKQNEKVKCVSSFFLMETHKKEFGSDGLFIFSDCGLNEDPTEEQLQDIAISSAESFRTLVGKEPKVVFLSYSTLGSAKSEKIDKIRRVVDSLKERNVDFKFDGELQLDAAIIKEVAQTKAPESRVAGEANVLIFPNIEAGNIGYKMAERFGDMLALGPVTQGMKKPVNDLSRGSSVEEIVGVIAITCVQAMNNK